MKYHCLVRWQIKIAKRLIEEGIEMWNSISLNNRHVLWENLVSIVNEHFTKIACCANRNLTHQVSPSFLSFITNQILSYIRMNSFKHVNVAGLRILNWEPMVHVSFVCIVLPLATMKKEVNVHTMLYLAIPSCRQLSRILVKMDELSA